MNLIILDEICKPPTESLSLRYLTMVSSDSLNLSVLIEMNRKNMNLNYKFLKDKGLMDYVDDLIILGHKEDGIRMDKRHDYPRTIIVSSVTYENVVRLIGQIKFLTTI